MTIRQRILKFFYPVFMWLSKLKGGQQVILNTTNAIPLTPFHSLSAVHNNGEIVEMANLKGNMVLIVNTASDCGYTSQLQTLEQLYRSRKGKLEILAFPSNEFKEQESGTDEAIARFCAIEYGTTFTLMKKSAVLKKQAQHKVFEWLTNQSLNGWNGQAPSWNFSKYLVDGEGKLLGYFATSVDPFDKRLTALIDAHTA